MPESRLDARRLRKASKGREPKGYPGGRLNFPEEVGSERGILSLSRLRPLPFGAAFYFSIVYCGGMCVPWLVWRWEGNYVGVGRQARGCRHGCKLPHVLSQLTSPPSFYICPEILGSHQTDL